MILEYQDRIDDYLLNRMPDNERLSFEKEVSEKVELREQLEYTRKVQEAIISRNEMLAAMQEWENDYHWKEEHVAVAGSANEVVRPVKRRLVYWVSAVAAVFVLGLFLLLRPTGSSTVTESNPDVVLSSSFKGEHDHTVINDMLQQKNYEAALTWIEKEKDSARKDSIEIAMDRTIDDEVLRYEMGHIKERQDELMWLEIQAFIGLDRQQEAMLIIDELRNGEGKYKQMADSLWGQINHN